MRLTLRSLLAYLDEILDEQDASELRKKIEDRETSGQLIHRIRHVVGQLRPDLPDLSASGLARDANSVAEYLDNTLPPDRVPDFERICLESDARIAEVAAWIERLRAQAHGRWLSASYPGPYQRDLVTEGANVPQERRINLG